MHPRHHSSAPWAMGAPVWGSRLSARRAASAVDYNNRQAYPAATIRLIEGAIGRPQDGAWSTEDVQAVADWQANAGFAAGDIDGKVGSGTLGQMARTFPRVDRALDAAQRKIIMEYTISFEGGRANPYAAQNRDGEYRGLFDKPKRDAQGRPVPVAQRTDRNWASRYNPGGGTHIGLSFGAWQGTQRGGTLGRMLQRMASKDRALFDQVFGGSTAAAALLRVTTAGRRDMGHGRNERTQPVDGADLWEAPWTARFTASATHEAFREAQREIADEQYLRDALETALHYGFTDQAAIAVLFDISIQFGVGGMRTRVRRALGRAGRQTARAGDIERVIGALPADHRARRRRILGRAESWVHYVASGQALAWGSGDDIEGAVRVFQEAGRRFLGALGRRATGACSRFVERLSGGPPADEVVALLGPLVSKSLTAGLDEGLRALPDGMRRVGAVSAVLRRAVSDTVERIRRLPAASGAARLAMVARELERLAGAELSDDALEHAVADAGNNGTRVLAALRRSDEHLQRALPSPERLERCLYEGWLDRHHGFQGGDEPHRGVLHIRFDLAGGQVTMAKVVAPRGAAVAAGLMATGPRSSGSLDPNQLRCRKFLVLDAAGAARRESGLLDADNRPVSGTLSANGPFRTALGHRLPLVDRLTG